MSAMEKGQKGVVSRKASNSTKNKGTENKEAEPKASYASKAGPTSSSPTTGTAPSTPATGGTNIGSQPPDEESTSESGAESGDEATTGAERRGEAEKRLQARLEKEKEEVLTLARRIERISKWKEERKKVREEMKELRRQLADMEKDDESEVEEKDGTTRKGPLTPMKLGFGIPTSGGNMFATSSEIPGSGAGIQVQRQATRQGEGGWSPLPMRAMPDYTGAGDKLGVQQWLAELYTQVDYYTTFGRLGGELEKVMWASGHLLEGARDWWQSEKMGKKVKSIEEFYTAVREQFQGAADDTLARAELQRVKKKAGESVYEYANGVQRILTRVPDMDMRSRVQWFCNGLPVEYQLEVNLKKGYTLQDAITIATQFEAAHKVTRGTVAPPGGVRTRLNNVEAEEEDDGQGKQQQLMAALTTTLAAMQAGAGGRFKSKERGDDRRSRGPFCFTCGSKTHDAAACTLPKPVCWRCKKDTHKKSECPDKVKTTTTKD